MHFACLWTDWNFWWLTLRIYKRILFILQHTSRGSRLDCGWAPLQLLHYLNYFDILHLQCNCWFYRHTVQVGSWDSHIGVASCLKWAPRRAMFVAASSVLTFWIPNNNSNSKSMTEVGTMDPDARWQSKHRPQWMWNPKPANAEICYATGDNIVVSSGLEKFWFLQMLKDDTNFPKLVHLVLFHPNVPISFVRCEFFWSTAEFLM